MSFYVYILRCSDGSYYTGHTETPGARLAAHQTGDFEGYTRQPPSCDFGFHPRISHQRGSLGQ